MGTGCHRPDNGRGDEWVGATSARPPLSLAAATRSAERVRPQIRPIKVVSLRALLWRSRVESTGCGSLPHPAKASNRGRWKPGLWGFWDWSWIVGEMDQWKPSDGFYQSAVPVEHLSGQGFVRPGEDICAPSSSCPDSRFGRLEMMS